MINFGLLTDMVQHLRALVPNNHQYATMRQGLGWFEGSGA